MTLEGQTKWRNQVQDAIKFSDYDLVKTPKFFDPTTKYSIFENYHKSEREVFEYDVRNLKWSDVVIVNFNVPSSIGTAMELMCAKENGIPVIGLNKDGNTLHPWLEECTTRMCTSMQELVDYAVHYFLQ